MVVWKCQAKIWGESYGRFTVWVGGMSRKASKFVSIRVVYPFATHPLEPRINQNLRTDRPEVLTKYGLWGSSIKYGYEAF